MKKPFSILLILSLLTSSLQSQNYASVHAGAGINHPFSPDHYAAFEIIPSLISEAGINYEYHLQNKFRIKTGISYSFTKEIISISDGFRLTKNEPYLKIPVMFGWGNKKGLQWHAGVSNNFSLSDNDGIRSNLPYNMSLVAGTGIKFLERLFIVLDIYSDVSPYYDSIKDELPPQYRMYNFGTKLSLSFHLNKEEKNE